MKQQLLIQERDWSNHIERRKRGFLNRAKEREFEHPRRKFNCRKLTKGRISFRNN